MCWKGIALLLILIKTFTHAETEYIPQVLVGHVGECEREERYCSADDKCIPEFWWCDGYRGDCSDGEDERQCSASDCEKTGRFHCQKSMMCVNSMSRCNGEKDCPDGEDEESCEEYVCPEGLLKCNDSTCIYGFVCDGTPQCAGGEDEEKCEEYQCPEGLTKCEDHTCAWAVRCDGWKQCKDGTDEKECEAFECPVETIKCKDHTCVFGEKCDGWKSCQDGSDEQECHEYQCPEGRMKCDDHSCAYGQRCDGNANCNDGSDERNCEECIENAVMCIADNRCIPNHYVCDSYPDCSDYQDDLGCGSCEKDEYMCSNGNCIDPSKICDGNDDCGDYTDESCFVNPTLVPIPLVPYYETDGYNILMSKSHQERENGRRERNVMRSSRINPLEAYKRQILSRLSGRAVSQRYIGMKGPYHETNGYNILMSKSQQEKENGRRERNFIRSSRINQIEAYKRLMLSRRLTGRAFRQSHLGMKAKERARETGRTTNRMVKGVNQVEQRYFNSERRAILSALAAVYRKTGIRKQRKVE